MLAEFSTSSMPIRMPIAFRRVMTVNSPSANRMPESTTKWPSERPLTCPSPLSARRRWRRSAPPAARSRRPRRAARSGRGTRARCRRWWARAPRAPPPPTPREERQREDAADVDQELHHAEEVGAEEDERRGDAEERPHEREGGVDDAAGQRDAQGGPHGDGGDQIEDGDGDRHGKR